MGQFLKITLRWRLACQEFTGEGLWDPYLRVVKEVDVGGPKIRGLTLGQVILPESLQLPMPPACWGNECFSPEGGMVRDPAPRNIHHSVASLNLFIKHLIYLLNVIKAFREVREN